MTRHLRLRIPEFYRLANEDTIPEPTKPPVDFQQPRPKKETWGKFLTPKLNNMFVEALASIIICFGAVYVPHFSHDPLAQLITSLSIVAIMMTLKDRSYFCPDATPVITWVLLCAGAYTRSNDGTLDGQWEATQAYDVIARLAGQATGAALIVFTVIRPNSTALQGSAFEQHLPPVNLYINEGVATAIEAIASAFVIMPLLRQAADVIKDEGTKYTSTFAAKMDTAPPSNKNLFNAATSLAILHVVLERLFRATMNPALFYMQCLVLGETVCSEETMWYVFIAQGIGLLVAGLYVYLFLPGPSVLNRILEGK